jgi:SAM-dependent methyltransferase
MQLAFGMPVFEYLTQHPHESADFNRTMIAFSAAELPAVADAYDFSGVRRIVDVGGGTGALLATVLGRYPQVSGVLFDRPDVIDEARAALTEGGVTERCEVVGGDFFESTLPSGDVYLMSHIAHDWDDDRCVAILRNCRKTIDPDGRLLLIEMVLPPGNEPHPAKMFDMYMLVVSGGMERTADEYDELLHSGGFRLTRIVPTHSAVSVIEAAPDFDSA